MNHLKKPLTKRKKREFVFKDFDNRNLDKAINLLTYGLEVKQLEKKKNTKLLLYIKEDNLSTLQCLSFKKKNGNKFKINLTRINNINEIPSAKLPTGVKIENLLCIIYNSDNSELILEFIDNYTKNLFWEGIQYFYQNARDAKFQTDDKFILN